jgi:hypothetical protein
LFGYWLPIVINKVNVSPSEILTTLPVSCEKTKMGRSNKDKKQVALIAFVEGAVSSPLLDRFPS